MRGNVCAITVAQYMTHDSENHCWRITSPKLQYVNEVHNRGKLDCAPQATAPACCTACLCSAVVQSWPWRCAVMQNRTDANLSLLVTGECEVYK